MNKIQEQHESTNLDPDDFPEFHRCDDCHRIPGTVFPGALALGVIKCLRCISKTQDDPARFMLDTLNLIDPVSRDMAVKYKDEFFEDNYQ